MLRAVFGYHLPLDPEVPKTGFPQRSTDGCKTWGRRELPVDPARHTIRITRLRFLRDGRLIATGGIVRGVPAAEMSAKVPLGSWEPLLLVAEDEGTSWDPPLDVMPPDRRPGWGGEEWDTAEPPDGELACVLRRTDPDSQQHREVRWQGFLKKTGKTWAMERLGPSPLPHSGHPDLLAAREGVVLHIATTGVDWTDDAGASRHRLEFPGRPQPYRSAYYSHSLQAKDSLIYVFSHRGGHDPYGRDEEVIMDTFRLAVGR